LDGTKLLDILIERGLVPEKERSKIIDEYKKREGSLISIIRELNLADEEKIARTLSVAFNLPYIDLRAITIEEKVKNLIPEEFARKNKVVPLKRQGRTLTVAIADPTRSEVLVDLKFITGFEIEPVISKESLIEETIGKVYGESDQLREILESLEEDVEIVEEEEPDVSELAQLIEEAPVVKLVNGLIKEAVMRKASDIHIEPYEKRVRVRMRIDGVLHEAIPIPYKLKDAVVSRIKVMARLDIAERRLPQDGHIRMKFQDKTIDLRVSTLPTVFGEKVVMRILDRSSISLDLEKLGFEDEDLEKFLQAIRKPYGLVLVTGPTGSGKTTTLYSAINLLNAPEVNIMTAEDPVEFDLMGINQVNVREEIGLTFASILRAFLRQDPDIILVGEIRDQETAIMAVRAALTGHMVLSTLHTNDAPSTVVRLVDMGIEPYLVADSLNLILAQRLLRKICEKCKSPVKIQENVLRRIGLHPDEIKEEVYKGEGCENCNGTGYKGREGVFEVMMVTNEIKDMILRKASINEIREKAIQDGMIPLREAAIRKFMRGITTIEEVIRITTEG